MKDNKKYQIDIEISKIEELETKIAAAILNKIKLMLECKEKLTPNAIASLASSALKAQKLFKNITPKSIPSAKDDENFQRAIKLLDEVAISKQKIIS
tara:strand:+ start:1856 stop:2146 length:291 start_codon:yes stop_codon:yes gene_type:complete